VFCGTLVGEHRSKVRKLKWTLRVGNNLTVNVREWGAERNMEGETKPHVAEGIYWNSNDGQMKNYLQL